MTPKKRIKLDKGILRDFREGKHYVPIEGLPEWEARQRSYIVEEQIRWREMINKADRDGLQVKCLSCQDILSVRNRNVQVLKDGSGVRCSSCRVV